MGFTSVDFARLGVRMVGRDPATRDPMTPGVRLGPPIPIDPALALDIGAVLDAGIRAEIRELTPGGFRGRWAVMQIGQTARGFFCAFR